MMTERQRGFTFVELVVVGVIIIGLVLTMLFLVTPRKRTDELHDAERRLHIAQLMQGVSRYYERTGTLPPAITADERLITSLQGGSDLCLDLVPEFLKDVPYDPTEGAKDRDEPCDTEEMVYSTGYTIRKSEDNTVTIAGSQTTDTKKVFLSRQFSRD